MSVSDELLCSFELLKPLDSAALKNHIKKGRNKRNSILSSPVSSPLLACLSFFLAKDQDYLACTTMPRFLSLSFVLSLQLSLHFICLQTSQPATVSAQSY